MLSTEHEISGDVLLEMDVAMLKEIDLVAFGKRVHIYNAIKELKARLSQPSSEQLHHSRPASSLAAAITPGSASGYEADSPGIMSPSSMSFVSASQGVLSPAPTTFASPYPASHSAFLAEPATIQGLGFNDRLSISDLQRSQNSVRLSFEQPDWC